MFDWLGQKLDSGSEPPFVLAGVMHYGITDVHPFADGNGRVARLFQVAVLMKAGVLPGQDVLLRAFLRGRPRRLLRRSPVGPGADAEVRSTSLHYFLGGLAEESERVAAAVEDLSALTLGGGTTPLRLGVQPRNGG